MFMIHGSDRGRKQKRVGWGVSEDGACASSTRARVSVRMRDRVIEKEREREKGLHLVG